jgi:hypothetical protein
MTNKEEVKRKTEGIIKMLYTILRQKVQFQRHTSMMKWRNPKKD